jgi:hypothetical protein
MTNAELGRRIHRSESYASLLRRNMRTPSTDLLVVILRSFRLSPSEAFDALAEGRFGTYLENTVLTTHEPGKDRDASQPSR